MNDGSPYWNCGTNLTNEGGWIGSWCSGADRVFAMTQSSPLWEGGDGSLVASARAATSCCGVERVAPETTIASGNGGDLRSVIDLWSKGIKIKINGWKLGDMKILGRGSSLIQWDRKWMFNRGRNGNHILIPTDSAIIRGGDQNWSQIGSYRLQQLTWASGMVWEGLTYKIRTPTLKSVWE